MLLQSSYYLPLETTYPNEYGWRQMDTVYFDANLYDVHHSKISLTLGFGNFIRHALLESTKSEEVVRLADGSFIKNQQLPYYNNLQVNFESLGVVDNLQYDDNVEVTRFKDSAQLQPNHSENFRLIRSIYNDTSSYWLSANGAKIVNEYGATKDSVLLEDMNVNAIEFTPLRYYDYYLAETPWYRSNEINRATYSRKSPLVCREFILQNGFYKMVPLDQFSYEEEFVPQFERKVNYIYSQDTSKMRGLLKMINPGLIDPTWYYIDYYRTYSGVPYGEGNDVYNTFEWTSSSSTDSVFTISNNQRQFVQSTSSNNTVEKDGNGRIIKITRRVSNKDFYKVMEIIY
jgi:hypothetical protein